jgi:hypothetical protein
VTEKGGYVFGRPDQQERHPMSILDYIFDVPRTLPPEGGVIVHNHIHHEPRTVPGVIGFRAWTVYNLLTRHGWRKLMPRPFHPKRDIAAQNAFKKAIFPMP